MVNFSRLLKKVECPICLGILRKAQLCVECMTRFCKECIETSMKDLQCPSSCVCFPKHHSLKDDKLVDAIISYLDLDDNQYQKEVKVRGLASSSGDGDSPSYPSENQTTIREREKARLMYEIFGPEITDDSDETGSEEEFMETNLLPLESLKWGKRGKRSMRSGTCKRHMLENHVGQHENTQDEMDIQVLLVSMDASVIPNLQNPQVICKQNVTMKSLCEMYVAPYVEAQVDEIEMFVVNELVTESRVIDPHTDRVQIVKKEDNVGGLMRMYDFNKGHVIIGYMKTPSDNQE
ncbi:hypothetical protein ISN45_Aa01g019940 [Arabidopsis thaliana x Arabidopsis arenosa]|uniref:RING-type domain-containing protein n=1 Tax=Arabidopsis thaliana x Arabidopsis arenosa TaxID=1240361 RepID=A0A8T2BZI0_9BRAS|nr:hypothetical protein ISN45_Aa01g019940 [Arabidopsis thaliana x Arabidopsis arenosa]